MFVSFAFDYGALLFRKPVWRTVAFWALVTAAILAVPTLLSGLTGQLGWFHVTAVDASDHLLPHRNAALISSGIIVPLCLWRVLRKDRLAGHEFALYLVILTIATVAIGYTGWLGAYVGKGY